MNIALVVPGGVDRQGEYRVVPFLLWFIERIARQHHVHVFALRQEPTPQTYPLLGATVHTIGRRWSRTRMIARILLEHRRARFDVLHAFWALPTGALAVMAGRLIARPVIVHVAGGELIALPDLGYGGRLRWKGRIAGNIAVRRASRVTAASDAILAEISALGRSASRIPLGVDTTTWPVAVPHPRDPNAPANLLHVASLNPVKDQPTLVRAAARLKELDVRYRLQIVGEDTMHGEVHRLAEKLNVADRVTFAGFLPQSELRPLMESADLFVLSSRHEAGPLVVLEAAVAGVPTVGTAVGHVAELAPRGAVAVPIGDAAALAGAVSRVLDDEPHRLALAEAAQAFAIQHDADETATRFELLYAEVAGARPAS